MVDNSNGSGGEVELNLAPIIDCFTVLITYLLVTASFISFAALDVSVSANNPSTQTPPPPVPDKPPLTMTMDVGEGSMIFLKVSGGDLRKDYEIKIPQKDGKWDAEALQKALLMITNRWSTLTEISVSAAPRIQYKELVDIINAAQKTLPKIYISAG